MSADDTEAETAEEPWARNRRLRLAQIEAEQEHGQQLVGRYGRGDPRPQFAGVGHMAAKRRRRR
jgi:hypothetical protein